jgi:hypothetical protein
VAFLSKNNIRKGLVPTGNFSIIRKLRVIKCPKSTCHLSDDFEAYANLRMWGRHAYYARLELVSYIVIKWNRSNNCRLVQQIVLPSVSPTKMLHHDGALPVAARRVKRENGGLGGGSPRKHDVGLPTPLAGRQALSQMSETLRLKTIFTQVD